MVLDNFRCNSIGGSVQISRVNLSSCPVPTDVTGFDLYNMGVVTYSPVPTDVTGLDLLYNMGAVT